MSELPQTICCPACGEQIEMLDKHGFTVWNYPNHMIEIDIYGEITVECLLQEAGSGLIPTASWQYVRLPEEQNKRDQEETQCLK